MLFKAQHGATGLVGPSRLKCIPGGSLEQSERQKRACSLPEDCQPSAGNGGASSPMALSRPPPILPLTPLCPTEKPARACCGSSKQTDFNARNTQHHHGRNSWQPSRAISCETRPPLALQLPARKPAWAASPSAVLLASAASPRLGEAVGLVQQGSAFRQQSR